MVEGSSSESRGYTKGVPLRCRLGLHKYGVKIYHEEAGSYVNHSIETCAYCGKERKGTKKLDWDVSK